jgi:hypothetical protein
MANVAPLQDSLHFDISVETVVVSDTVKIQTRIDALVEDGKSDADLRSEIRSTLRSFIEADWQISNLSRYEDATGAERVSLDATVRVSEKENYNLQARADGVSRRGLKISSVSVDASIPQDKIDEAHRTMRLNLLRKVRDEVAAINADVGSAYRIHTISYHTHAAPRSSNVRAKAARATLECASFGGAASDSADEALGNAQKLTLNGNIVLAQIVA